MSDSAPKLDARSLDDIVAQTEALLTAYTGWKPAAPDFASALIQLFGRMVDHVVQQLNEVPVKHQLAFTQLIGVRRTPPRAARAPITFALAPGDGTSVVPAGAQIAANDRVFETEVDLPLTRARLTEVYVRDHNDPNAVARYARRTDTALGGGGQFAALSVVAPPPVDPDNHPVDHELYVALDALLALPGASKLTLSTSGPTPNIAWSASDGQDGWGAVLASGAGPWVFADLTQLQSATVLDKSARWLRGVLASATPNSPVTLTARIDTVAASNGQPVDAAFYNSVALDMTRDCKPFGEMPGVGDVFYLSSDAAFATDGASVTISFTLTSPGAGSATIAWESWDGTRAKALTVTDGTKAFTASGNVTFTLDTGIPRSTINGRDGHWIRARITKGDYGHPVVVTDWTTKPPTVSGATLQPPIIGSIAIVASATSKPAELSVVRRTLLLYEPLGADSVVPYREAPDDDPVPALYLGFDRAFEAQLTTLYFEVAPPPPLDPKAFDQDPPTYQPPHLAWEYWSASKKAWLELTVEDGTNNLARSGLVRFAPLPDEASIERFGTQLHWLRVRSQDAQFSPVPQLGRIATNTVWASNLHSVAMENIGTSDGSPGQQLALAQRPVLEGQQIEVGEREAPTGDELTRVLADEGNDAITDDGTVHWVRWHAVPDFWSSGPRDRHYVFDSETATVTFGDATRGMIPPSGASMRAAAYRTGGGTAGNVGAHAIAQMKTTVLLVADASNYEAAVGGSDIEPSENVTARAARTLRHGGRAVTAQDFADLALESSGAIARAVTITPAFSPIDWEDVSHPHELDRDGRVIVIIVPADAHAGKSPPVDLLTTVTDYLVARSAPSAKVQVIGPTWIATDITVHVVSTTIENNDATLTAVRDAIFHVLDPVHGGDDGQGWDFGRKPRASDLIACIARVPGVDHVSQITISCASPFDGDDLVGPGLSIDQLSLTPRLLFYPNTVAVTAARREVS